MGSAKSLQRLVLMLLLAFSFIAAMPTIFTGSAKAAQTTNVTISDLAFNPQNVTVKVGSTITWTNNDPLIYTLWFVKADDRTTYAKAGKEGLSDPILPSKSWSQTFNEVVTLQYYGFERLWITGFIRVVPMVPPTASFTYSPDKPITNQTITFNASESTDQDGTLVSYTWNFSDGTVITETDSITYHAFSTFGTHDVTLTVTDDDGLTDTESKLMTIYEPPVAAFTYTRTTPLAGEIVTFNASQSTDLDGTVQSYFWDFGDGSSGSGEVVTNTYAVAGTYNVTLTVTDDDGLINSTWKTITILPIHDIAVTSVTPSPTEVTSGENVTITVVAKNEGTVAETLTVTVYSNDTAIDAQTVTNLAAGNSETLEFVWDTTNATEGNYVIKAEASQVTGETDTADNTLTSDATVTVKRARPPFTFPPIEIIGLILFIIAILLGLGAYVYIKRARVRELFEKELEKAEKDVVALSGVTDPYQPAERKYEITRGCARRLSTPYVSAFQNFLAS